MNFHYNLFGLYTVYSSVLRNGHAVIDQCKHVKQQLTLTKNLAQRILSLLLVILLLSGDVHSNPGPAIQSATNDICFDLNNLTLPRKGASEISVSSLPQILENSFATGLISAPVSQASLKRREPQPFHSVFGVERGNNLAIKTEVI